MEPTLTRVDRSVGKVTDSSGLDNVAHSESLDGLVLGDGARAVRAANKSDVASAVLVTAVVSSSEKKQECEFTCRRYAYDASWKWVKRSRGKLDKEFVRATNPVGKVKLIGVVLICKVD